jgi:starvation-inducible DNA-binding protein
MTVEMTSRPAPDTAGHDVSDQLVRLLADTYTLYLKTLGYHWNVTGPAFRSLHLMFEEQYMELRDAIDEIAERIRTWGVLAPGSYRQMAPLTSIVEDEGAPEAMEMVRRLAADQETVVATAKEVVRAAEEAGDVATVDLATRRIAVHEKALWMLRATLAPQEVP